MADTIGMLSLLATLVLLPIGLYHLLRRTGKAGRMFKYAGTAFVVMVIAVVLAGPSDVADVPDNEPSPSTSESVTAPGTDSAHPTGETASGHEESTEGHEEAEPDEEPTESTGVDTTGEAPTTEDVAEQVEEPETASEIKPGEQLTVHFIDVGQGDATLLQGPDFTILIDAGDYRRDDVAPYLQAAGVEDIDLLIGTHPHADHMGQFPQVLSAFTVKEVWLSGDEHTSKTFERAVDAILESDATYHEPRAGEKFAFGGLQVQVLNPAQLSGDFHEGSIGMRVVFGDVAFVFTGDAEQDTEREMIARGHTLSAHILQLGHHGSRTSTSSEFLNAVSPEVAIYSAGSDNTYGHPHEETIARLLESDIDVYGTDVHGTVRVVTDGTGYEVYTERTGEIRAPPATEEESTADSGEGDPESEPAPAGCVDINSASFEELQAIIHIGPARAEELIRLRPFKSVDGLTRIDGIGPARLEDIKEQGLACVK